MDSVINLINNKIDELKNIDIDNDSVEFLKMFNATVTSLCKIDFIDLVTCFYMVKKDVSLESSLNEINSIHAFLEDIDELDYEDVLCLVDAFYELKEKYKEKLGNFQYNDYMSLFKFDGTLSDTKKLLKDYSSVLSIDEINKFLNWMNDDELTDIICLAAALKGIKTNLEKTVESANDLEIPEFFNRKLTRKLSEYYIKDVNSSYITAMNEELNEDIEELKSYKDKKIREVTSLKRSINKKLKNLQQLVESLNKNKLTVDELLKLTDDEEIIYFVLLDMIKRKNQEFENVYQKLEGYQKNPINKLEKMFHDYNYNFNLLTEDEQNQLMSLGNDAKIQENLSFFSSSNFKFIEEIDEAFVPLLLLDIENLMQIDSLLAREKISQEFVLKYGNLFDSLSIKILVRNINKLDMQKIDLSNLEKYNDKIIWDLNIKLFELIVAYGIDLKNQNLKQYEFLEQPELLDIIDEFIEIGLYNQIKTLPNLINSQSSNVIKRIMLMNQIGQDYLNERNTLNQTARTGKDFYLGDDMLNEYTYANYQIYMDEEILNILKSKDNLEIFDELPEEISFIESFKKNNQVYMIGDKCFSRIKVLRCIKTLMDLGYTNYKDMLFNALIYNHPNYLSFETIEEVKNIDDNNIRKQLK